MWGVQIPVVVTSVSQTGASEKRSKATGWVKYLVEAVMRIITNGTAKTAHLVRRPVARFMSCGDARGGDGLESVADSVSTKVRGTTFLGLNGNGDGGGVNMRVCGDSAPQCMGL